MFRILVAILSGSISVSSNLLEDVLYVLLSTLSSDRVSLKTLTNHPLSFVGQTVQQTEYVGFNNPLALSLKDNSNRLYAIGHFLRENGCFNKEHPVSFVMGLAAIFAI